MSSISFAIISIISILLAINQLNLSHSQCSDNFSIDSYALTSWPSRGGPYSSEINIFEFMSSQRSYWLMRGLQKRVAKALPVDGIDAVFFIDTTLCSNGSFDLMAIKANSFARYSIAKGVWMANQPLKSHILLSKILEPIDDNMKIDAITDWKPNRIIVFRNKSFRVYEWKSICEAIKGNGIKSYPPMRSNNWFPSSSIDASQMINLNGTDKLLLFSKDYYREVDVEHLDQSSGELKGSFGKIKPLKDMFVCFPKPKEPTVWVDDRPETEAGVEGTQSEQKHSKQNSDTLNDKSDKTLIAIISAVVILSLALIVLVITLPKDKYIIVREGED